jgi:phosphoenolpyruvate carboxylase
MSYTFESKTDKFRHHVAMKFQLFNSLFLSLPFTKIEKTGMLLPLLLSDCEEGFEAGLTVPEIIDRFFKNHTTFGSETEKIDFVFRCIQYIERQIVLFDALEDAAYPIVNDLSGPGTIKALADSLSGMKGGIELPKSFCVRPVLTAHPTQFYPDSVLAIIQDLADAFRENDTAAVNMLLQQLGKTPFLNLKKPTPFDEATSLIWYLENIFFQSVSNILQSLNSITGNPDAPKNSVVKMGFWPGGDRDGNPFVTADTTFKVANALHFAVMRCYLREVQKLRRRLTFSQVNLLIADLEEKLYTYTMLQSKKVIQKPVDIINPLISIKALLIEMHNGLFAEEVSALIRTVETFGLHFAFVDIRQENMVHTSLLESFFSKRAPEYLSMNEPEKMDFLASFSETIRIEDMVDEVHADTIKTIQTVSNIQLEYGEDACHRYIISQCSSALNVLEVLTLLRLAGDPGREICMDIVPLFETIDDLYAAPAIMETLFSNTVYKKHLVQRKQVQTIMLGFSDGTKDGGYLMANWMIYKTKQTLSAVAEKFGVQILFFDGRGGPPARGGGKTHKFYASLPSDIASHEIQLTIQGQTISSNFGIIESAQFNLEQLISAGVTNQLLPKEGNDLDDIEKQLITDMAQISLDAYQALRNHPDFVNYMTDATPLKYFGETNIGSRPAKRGKTDQITIKDFRAIPFVASWNMVKQNIPGFYGLGTAIQSLKNQGKFESLKALYQKSLFFRTLIDNSEMALIKSFMPLSAHLEQNSRLGSIRRIISDEYHLSVRNILELGDHEVLMQEYEVDKLSVQMREKIVLPLVTIQQYALHRLREAKTEPEMKGVYEKIIIRSTFGIINAGRNSA